MMDGNTAAVVAEQTIELTDSPVHFKWAGHGLKLHVPAGALRHQDSKCSLHLQAYQHTNELKHSFKLPEGFYPVSAIYSISASGVEKKVSVEIEHCLSSASDRAKAICVVDDHSIGKFRPKEDYEIHDSYCKVPLKVSHTRLCWVAVAGRQGCATKLSAHLYLQCESLTRRYLHFVLTRNLQVSMKAIDAEYLSNPQTPTSKLLHLPRVVLADQSKTVTLNIPREGEATPTGWRISPTEYPPEVTCGLSKPSICLLVERDSGRGEEEGAQPFEYTMRLKGTQTPQSFLVYYTDQTLESFSPVNDHAPDSCVQSVLDPELGVEIATEDRLAITSSSSHFDFSDSSGFSLEVPDDVLSPGDPSCTVEVKSVAGELGAFVYPDNCKPISAVYHISSSTTQLCSPVMFTMEHFSLQKDPSELRTCKFVAASSVGDLPYEFSCVSEWYGVRTGSGQVSLESLSPTFLAIVQEEVNGGGAAGIGEDQVDGPAARLYNLLPRALRRQSSKSYCAMVFYRCPACPDIKRFELDFVVLRNEPKLIQGVKRHYSDLGFHIHHSPMLVIFKKGEREVGIDIRDDGAKTDDGKWRINPSATPLLIRKEYMDDYNGETVIPKCQLTIKLQVPDDTPDISYMFRMQGLETPQTVLFYKDFNSKLRGKDPPKEDEDDYKSTNVAKTAFESPLSTVHFQEVRKALLHIQCRWWAVGNELSLSVDDLSNIRDEPTFRDNDARLSQMIILWLKRRDPRPTWKALIEALESETVKEEGLACDLRNKFT